MRGGLVRNQERLDDAKPYWSYEDIGVFFLVLVLLGSVLRFLVRLGLLQRSELTDPSFGLQFAMVASLSLALYLVLKIRHHQPVLQPGEVPAYSGTDFIIARDGRIRRPLSLFRQATLSWDLCRYETGHRVVLEGD